METAQVLLFDICRTAMGCLTLLVAANGDLAMAILSTIPQPARPTATQSTLDEASLLIQLRAGNDAAFENLFHTHAPRMLTVARGLLQCEDDAADAVQEAFVSAFRSMDRFEGGSSLGTWLHRIVVNAALMKLRTLKRRHELSIESLLPTFHDDGHRRVTRAAWQSPPEDLLQREETRQTIRDKMQLLPDDYRTVIILRDFEEMDTESTAEALGITTAAVKTRLHRARMALRELLEGELA
jgi:RNA polymerase sigma-70 factor, ECF subfamily